MCRVSGRSAPEVPPQEMLTEMLTKMESSNQHMCKKIDLLLAAQKFANHCGLKEGGGH